MRLLRTDLEGSKRAIDVPYKENIYRNLTTIFEAFAQYDNLFAVSVAQGLMLNGTPHQPHV